MLSRVIEETVKEDFTLDHFLWDDDDYSRVDFVDLPSSDEMSLESSQTTSLHSDTIISSMRVGSEDQKMEKPKRKRRKRTPEQRTAKQLKRLEHRMRCRLTFNRMVKDDLRRVFPIMYCNVINAYNTSLTKSFLVRYSRPDCEVIAHPFPSIGVSLSRLKGPHEFANYLGAIKTLLPDVVLLLLGSRVIRKFYEECSIIEMFTNLKATRLTYPVVSSVGDQVNVGPSHAEVVEAEVKMEISFFMNKEGLIFKIEGQSSSSSCPVVYTNMVANISRILHLLEGRTQLCSFVNLNYEHVNMCVCPDLWLRDPRLVRSSQAISYHVLQCTERVQHNPNKIFLSSLLKT
eukprot:scaffold1389_cov251-Ochromonas_danica.AAC.2